MALTTNIVRAQFGMAGARNNSDYICARAAVTTSEQITVPSGANIVVMNSTLPFHIAFGANPTATVPADDDTGASNELVNPNSPIESRTFICTGIAKIAVAAASSTMVTASFYKT